MRAFVFVENIDTPLVAIGFRPRGGQERINDRQRFRHGVHAAADADQLSVVVLTGHAGRVEVVAERGAHTVDVDLLVDGKEVKKNTSGPGRIGVTATCNYLALN